MTTKTYHSTYNLVIAVEADSQEEAMKEIHRIKLEVFNGTPVGARLGRIQHSAREGAGREK